MTWKQIIIPEDPEWVEYHKEMMTQEYGRIMLKVWNTSLDYTHYMMSIVKPSGEHAIQSLEATNIEDAKREALEAVK